MVFSCSFCKKKCVKGIGCYSFPKDKKLCDQWLVACNFDLHPKNNTLKLKLCSRHFKKDCFIIKDNGRKLLKPNAIPTILHIGKKVQKLNSFGESQRTCYISPDCIEMKCEVGEVKIEPYTVDSRFTDECGNTCLIIKSELEDEAYIDQPIPDNIKNEFNIENIKNECINNDNCYNTAPNKRMPDLTEYTVASLDFSSIEPCNIGLKVKDEFNIR